MVVYYGLQPPPPHQRVPATIGFYVAPNCIALLISNYLYYYLISFDFYIIILLVFISVGLVWLGMVGLVGSVLVRLGYVGCVGSGWVS
jgi:hypothetical protein